MRLFRASLARNAHQQGPERVGGDDRLAALFDHLWRQGNKLHRKASIVLLHVRKKCAFSARASPVTPTNKGRLASAALIAWQHFSTVCGDRETGFMGTLLLSQSIFEVVRRMTSKSLVVMTADYCRVTLRLRHEAFPAAS